MRRFCTFAFIAAIAAASLSCVAVVDDPYHEPVINVTQVHPDPGQPILFGPVTVAYDIVVFNPSHQPVALRAVDLRTGGGGNYSVARQTRTLNLSIAPGETVSARIHVAAWGKGGMASSYEPVTIQGIAWFSRAHHRRVPVAFEMTP